MTDRIPFDLLDRRLLAALDPDFVIEDNNEVATFSGPITIRIVRIDDDSLEMAIEFANVELPILLSRSQTLRQLHIAGES